MKMIATLPFLVCVIGFFLWLIFTKWNAVADGWVADLGKVCFAAGLLVTLLSVIGKSVL